MTEPVGPEATNERSASLFSPCPFKPQAAEALQPLGLTQKELYERAEVGRETPKLALYGRASKRTADACHSGRLRRRVEAF